MTDWKWFRHRIGSDPKLSKLVREFGTDGYAVYFKALEYIYDGGLGDIEVEEIASTFGLDTERVTAILTYAKDKCKGLLKLDSNGFWTSTKALELMAEDEDRKEANREKQRRFRESHNHNVTVSNGYVAVSNPIDKSQKRKDTDKSKEKDKVPKESDRPTDRPTLENVVYIMRKVGRNFDASRFFDYWEQKGWMIDGEPIRRLESVVRSWPNDKPAPTPTESHPEYAKRMEEARTSL